MDLVMDALTQAAQEAEKDAEISAYLLAPPEAVGWVDITETAVRVQLAAKTKPGRQWDVAQVLRKYALSKLHTKTEKPLIILNE
jgi:small-conductance mechanosensitive channel